MSQENKSFQGEDFESPFVTQEFYTKENWPQLPARLTVPQVNEPLQRPLEPSPAYTVETEFEGSEFLDDTEDQEAQLGVGRAEDFDESMIEELEGDPASWLGPSSSEYEPNATTQWSPAPSEAGEDVMRNAMEAGLFTPELFEAIPENLERLAPREYVIVADGRDTIPLQERVVRHLTRYDRLYPPGDKEKTKGLRKWFSKHKCVGTSLFHFWEVCQSLGVTTDSVTVGKGENLVRLLIPRVLKKPGKDGRQQPFSWKVFLRLWYSNTGGSRWGKIDEKCRGGGAAGALLYAGLVENDTCITSRKGENCWPSGLRPGAFLQLWQDEQTYEAVKNVNKVTLESKTKKGPLGHSCIFRDLPDNQKSLIVADQLGQKSVWGWGVSFRYLIGANLKRVKIASRLD